MEQTTNSNIIPTPQPKCPYLLPCGRCERTGNYCPDNIKNMQAFHPATSSTTVVSDGSGIAINTPLEMSTKSDLPHRPTCEELEAFWYDR